MNLVNVEIVKKLKEYDSASEEYINSLPSGLDIVYDNPYVDSKLKMIDLLVNMLFKKDADEVKWFLTEFTAGKSSGPHIILADGTEFTFKTNEDYYEYLRKLK